MGAQVIDYRVSTLVVLCKDCGNDVGLYPARHKCLPIERPAMPTLPAAFAKEKRSNLPSSLELSSRSLSSTSSMASSPSSSSTISPLTPSNSKWSSARLGGKTSPALEDNEDSVYFNTFAANLPETVESSGKKLWGKVRQNEKWKQLSEKNEKPTQSAKLWGKLIQATQNMADKIPSRDDHGAESDGDDWEGETHVSRIIREYYEKKNLPLPAWLFDERLPVPRSNPVRTKEDYTSNTPARTPSRRRLWEQDEEKKISSRERERRELREMPPKESTYENRGRDREEDQYPINRYRDDDRSGRYREEDQYQKNRYRDEDQYQSNSYREEDRSGRYREEDRYYSDKNNDRYPPSRNENESYRRRADDYYKPREEARHRQYDDDYNRDSVKKNDYYEDDHYNSPPSRSPQQQRTNSTHRRKLYEGLDENSKQTDVYRSKSTRNAQIFNSPPLIHTGSNHHDNAGIGRDTEDYHYKNNSNTVREIPHASRERSLRRNLSESIKRDPIMRSASRRYVNESNYF